MKTLRFVLMLSVGSFVSASAAESTIAVAAKLVERPFSDVQAAAEKFISRGVHVGFYFFSTNEVAGEQLTFTFADCTPPITGHIPQGRLVMTKSSARSTWVRIYIDKLKDEDIPITTTEQLAKGGQFYLNGILTRLEPRK